MNKIINKRNYLLLIIAIFMATFATPVLAAPTVNLDGRQLAFEVPPAIEDGRTLVPLRAIFEAMGATVSWDQATQTASAVKDNTTVVLKIGSTKPTINGKVKPLDVPAKIVNGRTLAPLRFVGEAFGGAVAWDGTTQTITIISPQYSAKLTKVHFIDVGQADCIYIQLPNHNDILIDGGNVADGPAVVDYLKAQGVDDIELMVATHPHEDHIGGLSDVLSAFRIDQIIDSGKDASTKTYRTYAAGAKAEGCTWLADNYQTFTYGKVALQILTGAQEWGNEVNDYSVVCRLDTGDIEFLFMGDAETPVEQALTGNLEAEILKVGHHGSSSSSSPDFLKQVNPEAAVICCGAGNTYGHPHQETLDNLGNIGADVYRTDLNGNIMIATDGATYFVNTVSNLKVPEAASLFKMD